MKCIYIKGVVFLTFYQLPAIQFGLWLIALVGYNAGSDATTFNNFLICFEMLIASALHMYFFPVNEWDQNYAKEKKLEKERKGESVDIIPYLFDALKDATNRNFVRFGGTFFKGMAKAAAGISEDPAP